MLSRQESRITLECDRARPFTAAATPPRRMRRRQRLAAQMRACLLWGLAFFLAAQLGMLLGTQYLWPQLRDPEYGYKLALLRRHRAAEPDRPLLVLLGSSRTGQGIRPGVLADLPATNGRTPLVFNLSLVPARWPSW
jgi:hypothetical protein